MLTTHKDSVCCCCVSSLYVRTAWRHYQTSRDGVCAPDLFSLLFCTVICQVCTDVPIGRAPSYNNSPVNQLMNLLNWLSLFCWLSLCYVMNKVIIFEFWTFPIIFSYFIDLTVAWENNWQINQNEKYLLATLLQDLHKCLITHFQCCGAIFFTANASLIVCERNFSESFTLKAMFLLSQATMVRYSCGSSCWSCWQTRMQETASPGWAKRASSNSTSQSL